MALVFEQMLTKELGDASYLIGDDSARVAAVVDPGWVKTRMGGPNATLKPEDSIGQMRATFEGLGAEQSGGFFQRDGKTIPW